MTTLDLAQQHVALRKVGSEWHGACPACGSGKSGPDKTDRFSVKADGRFFCRSCTPSGGDAVTFLLKFEGKSCPDAHIALDKVTHAADGSIECDNHGCQVRDKCRLGQGRTGRTRRSDTSRKTPQTKKDGPTWAPMDATEPADLWRANARVLVDWAHQRLLKEPEQLAWLAARGLPLEAVQRYNLGWWPETKFRKLAEWGLPEEINPQTKRQKKVWLPRGLVIPTFVDGQVDRIRFRRHADDLGDGRGKYVALKGSSDDVPVYGEDRKAFVVVESDLDGLLVHWLAGDIVGAIPLASCSVKPRTRAAAILDQALCILVALDFEPRTNEQTGRHENPGGQSAIWWQKTYRQSRRWPVPSGKDPGEYFQDHAGDIRQWVVSGLPPGLRVQAHKKPQPPQESVDSSPVEETIEETAPAIDGPRHWVMQSKSGRTFHIVETEQDARQIAKQFDGEAVFTVAEIEAIKAAGMDSDDTATILLARATFGFGEPLQIKSVSDRAEDSTGTFDPSRARAARHGSARV